MGGSTLPQKKSNTEVVELASSDEESASSSSDKGSRSAAANGDEVLPSSLLRTTARPQARPMADSYHQLPSLIHGEGTATSAKWIV